MRAGPVLVFSKTAWWSRTIATPSMSTAIACPAVLRASAGFNRPALISGDFNWRATYEDVLRPFGGVSASRIASVHDSLAAPTRAVALGCPIAFHLLPYPLDRSPASRAMLRSLARLGRSCSLPLVAAPRDVITDVQCRSGCVNLRRPSKIPCMTASPNQIGVVRSSIVWPAEEKVCQAAVRLGIADCEQPAELTKASYPSSRPVAPTPLHRHGESIALRQWKRLHRAAAEQWRRSGAAAELTPSQLMHWHVRLQAPNHRASGEAMPVTQAEAVSSRSFRHAATARIARVPGTRRSGCSPHLDYNSCT